MTIYSLTVGHNEQHRYLRSCMENIFEWADEMFFYDDMSTDLTPFIAQEYAQVRVRGSLDPSFNEDEGQFRQSAWNAFEHAMSPEEGDWVFVIDCDEMVVPKPDWLFVAEAVESLCDSIDVPYSIAFQEVFGTVDGTPQVRVDGFWGVGFAPRLFPYRRGAQFAHGKVGVPAVPSYVMAQSGRWRQTDEISVMHYGYANSVDWPVKHARYNGIPGHHPDHIASILGPKDLVPWGGRLPGVMIYGDH